MRALALPLPLLLAACAAFPDVEAAIPADAIRGAPPPLVPLDGALAAVPPVDPGRDAGMAETAARAGALRSRAATLDAPGDADTARRLARLRARAAVLSRPAPDFEAVEAIAEDLAATP